MPLEPFIYELPEERIAQRPVTPYDAARLLVVDRRTANLSPGVFSGIPALLAPGDLIVFNNTRVIPARLYGEFEANKGPLEILLLEQQGAGKWLCLGKPMRKMRPNAVLSFGAKLKARVLQRRGAEEVELQFRGVDPAEPLDKLIEENGNMPIPPYIRRGKSDEADRRDYQTSFAEVRGSIAAPTASLHFTQELLKRIKEKGVEIAYLTLHVGAASIKPLWRDGQSGGNEISKPGAERLVYDPLLLEKIKAVKGKGGRIVAVGTTVVRALESMARFQGEPDASESKTELFITPPFEFKVADVVITNFHQPATTHLFLVEAFMGSRELLRSSYQYALDNNFRFLSYGDGMCIM